MRAQGNWWWLVCLAACSAPMTTVEPGDGGSDGDAGLVDDTVSSGPIEPGWLAPFALDPVAQGFPPGLSWDFTSTAVAAGLVRGSGDYENASRADAPRSAPGVGRALMGPVDDRNGVVWLPTLATMSAPRRIYFRVMFALSDNYAAAPGRETFFSVVQTGADARTLGQATVDFRAVTLDGGVPALALWVGTLTPNGASRMQASGPRLQPGRWHQLEALLVSESDAGRDGVARLWLDGRRVLDWPALAWAPLPSSWRSMSFSSQRTTDPEADGGQYRDYDHLELYVSPERE